MSDDIYDDENDLDNVNTNDLDKDGDDIVRPLSMDELADSFGDFDYDDYDDDLQEKKDELFSSFNTDDLYSAETKKSNKSDLQKAPEKDNSQFSEDIKQCFTIINRTRPALMVSQLGHKGNLDVLQEVLSDIYNDSSNLSQHVVNVFKEDKEGSTRNFIPEEMEGSQIGRNNFNESLLTSLFDENGEVTGNFEKRFVNILQSMNAFREGLHEKSITSNAEEFDNSGLKEQKDIVTSLAGNYFVFNSELIKEMESRTNLLVEDVDSKMRDLRDLTSDLSIPNTGLKVVLQQHGGETNQIIDGLKEMAPPEKFAKFEKEIKSTVTDINNTLLSNGIINLKEYNDWKTDLLKNERELKKQKENILGAQNKLIFDNIMKFGVDNGPLFDEAVSSSTEGVLRTIEDYNSHMGYEFSTLSVRWIQNSIIKSFNSGVSISAGDNANLMAYESFVSRFVDKNERKPKPIEVADGLNWSDIQVNYIEKLRFARKNTGSFDFSLDGQGTIGDAVSGAINVDYQEIAKAPELLKFLNGRMELLSEKEISAVTELFTSNEIDSNINFAPNTHTLEVAAKATDKLALLSRVPDKTIKHIHAIYNAYNEESNKNYEGTSLSHQQVAESLRANPKSIATIMSFCDHLNLIPPRSANIKECLNNSVLDKFDFVKNNSFQVKEELAELLTLTRSQVSASQDVKDKVAKLVIEPDIKPKTKQNDTVNEINTRNENENNSSPSLDM